MQWAQSCHRRATGAEEATIYAKEDVRRIKELTRKIRLGQSPVEAGAYTRPLLSST